MSILENFCFRHTMEDDLSAMLVQYSAKTVPHEYTDGRNTITAAL